MSHPIQQPIKILGAEASVDVTTSAAEVLPASTTRQGVIVQNTSDTNIFLTVTGETPVASGSTVGFLLAANGGSLAFQGLVATGAFKAIHNGTGSKRLHYWEASL